MASMIRTEATFAYGWDSDLANSEKLARNNLIRVARVQIKIIDYHHETGRANYLFLCCVPPII